MDPTKLFKKFLADETATDMKIEGEAGTGKTTQLVRQVQHAQDNGVEYMVTAFTHKACGILRSKLPADANVSTFHAWLKKRPTINQDATNISHIESNVKHGEAAPLQVLFVDEFSMIGEKDLEDLKAEQIDPDTGLPKFKVLWLGDPNQLRPVGDKSSEITCGKYHIILKKQYRTSTTNPLYGTLRKLVTYIEKTAEPAPLEAHSNLIRGINLESNYLADDRDKVLLAYTNERVEELNATMQGYDQPEPGDLMFSPTSKHKYNFASLVPSYLVYRLDRPWGEPLEDDKYKTLPFLTGLAGTLPIQFMDVYNHELEGEQTVAVVFGHYQFKILMEELKRDAAEANENIELEFDVKAATWAKQNPTHPLARKRARAWRKFLTVNQNVICMDFAHAMTVHKSQGSTYEHVYVDSDDMAKAQRNMDTYLRLTYVAYSRASVKVFTN